jgi:hypothetical protein
MREKRPRVRRSLGAAYERDAGKPLSVIDLTHDAEYGAPFLFL